MSVHSHATTAAARLRYVWAPYVFKTSCFLMPIDLDECKEGFIDFKERLKTLHH